MSRRAVVAGSIAVALLFASGCEEAPRKESVRFSKLGLDIPSSYFDGNAAPTLPSGDENYSVIHAIFPSMRPATSSEWNDPSSVRVTIRRIQNATRTEHLLSEYERLKYSDTSSRPILAASSPTERKFLVRYSPSTGGVATYIVRTLSDGSHASIEDSGGWSANLSCNRRIGELEVTYQFRKERSPDAARIDVAVVSLLQRLKSSPAIKQ